MNQKALFDSVSISCSRKTTHAYSTSFSLGIRTLGKQFRDPVYAVYGFVRFADEIVDTFHDYDKEKLMARFREDTVRAIEDKISLNPILNSFQAAYHQFNFDWDLVDTFLKSMEMDLAEVVGLMCLKVFVEGDQKSYDNLKPYAMKLGAAFQKINFLRDLKADYQELGRTYFPGINLTEFNAELKKEIEADIALDFQKGYEGILLLPRKARFGVYMAYKYYFKLFNKIKQTPAENVLTERIRIPNYRKMRILLTSYVRHNLNLL